MLKSYYSVHTVLKSPEKNTSGQYHTRKFEDFFFFNKLPYIPCLQTYGLGYVTIKERGMQGQIQMKSKFNLNHN